MIFDKYNTLRKIANIILQQEYNIDEVLLLEQNHRLFSLIASNLKRTKYNYPNRVFQAIHQNQNYFIKKCTTEVHLAKEVKLNNDTLLSALAELQATKENFILSYRRTNSLYGKLCLKLNRKNILNNRMCIYKLLRGINKQELIQAAHSKVYPKDPVQEKKKSLEKEKSHDASSFVFTPEKKHL